MFRREARAYVEENFDRFLDDLLEFVGQPSVSATGEGVDECTDLLERLSDAYGFDETRVVETPGQPSVISRAFVDGDPDNDAPTVLVYGHYDTQPVDPERWETPPFDPTFREVDGEEYLFCRGVSDMKGQLFAHLVAVEALRETGGLPANVTLLSEGEEESGSPNVERVVAEHVDVLSAGVLYRPDGEVDSTGRPLVKLGDRGLVMFRIDCEGANRELHSGNFGGPIPNPIWELTRLVDSMRDADGVLTVDGVYDDVRELTDLDRETLDAIPFDEEGIAESLDVEGYVPGRGDSFVENLMYQPYLNVQGFTAGYGGEGNKNAIPTRARAKFDFRLVPDQDPDAVYADVLDHVAEHGSALVEWEVTRLDGDERSNRPTGTPLDSPFLPPIREAVRDVWDEDPIVHPRSGGSGPYDVFEDYLDVHHFAVPYGSTGSRRHGPNENMSLRNLELGMKTSAAVFERLAGALEERAG
jgi:acetylornithine deacetylase/succinyl-diaminopimelate desuccinylase-like protein